MAIRLAPPDVQHIHGCVWAGARRALAPILQAIGTAPATQGAASDTEHLAGLVLPRSGRCSLINQYDGHLFHRLGNQSSVLVGAPDGLGSS